MKLQGAAQSICNLKYSVPKNIPTAFHNGSSNNYHFTIKKLTEELKKHFTCLGKTTGKCIIFVVPIEKQVTRNHKCEQEITKNISYILQFIDNARFMGSSF